MNSYKTRHLNEEQLIRSVVDKTSIPLHLQHHLSECPKCLKSKNDLELKFIKIGETAKTLSPFPMKRPQLPPEKSKPEKSKIVRWRPVLVTAFTVLLVISGVLLSYLSRVPTESVFINDFSYEIWEDKMFMEEISFLAENALPLEYMEFLNESGLELDEDSIESVTSPKDIQSSSKNPKKKGDPLC